jgi:hypothetical protein
VRTSAPPAPRSSKRRLSALSLAAALAFTGSSAPAAPYTYKEANNFSAQLQRSFNSAPTSFTTTVYKSTITGSGTSPSSSSSSSRSRSGGGGFASPSDSYSWGMPSRQTGYNWGPGYVPPPDPEGDKLAAARLKVWDLPTPPLADAAKIARYYQSQGVSASRAQQAARDDETDYQRAVEKRASDAKWAAYDREQLRISQYRASQNAGRTAFRNELAAVRARALASGSGDRTGLGADPAAAQAWLDLAGSTQMWRGTYIEYDPLARREAVFFAARAGVTRARIAAWDLAKEAGEDVAYWHAQAVLAGDIEAIRTYYKETGQNPAAGFARAAVLFERAYEIMPATPSHRDRNDLVGAARAQCAFYLSSFYARGAADLTADPARALAWAKKLPSPAPASWQEMSIYSRAKALRQLETNILAVRAVEKEIVAAWESILAAGTEAGDARRALYPIYLGRHHGFPTSADPSKARALFPDGPDDLDLILQVGDWAAAAKYEALPLDRHFRLPLFLGRLWRERTDGRRDLDRARAALEYALSNPKASTGNGEAAVALSEIQLENGERANAQLTLEKAAKEILFTGWRPRLRLALGFYRGEFHEIDEKAGDEQMAILAKSIAESSRQNLDYMQSFVREFEFQRVAAPLLLHFNKIEAIRLGNALPDGDAPADPARLHRENFARFSPRLRELALAGYADATRLWALLTLSPYAEPAPADAALAKNFLHQSAAAGDASGVVVLAQRLCLDAQAARLIPDATPARLREQFAEAAAWLETSWKTGHTDALRSLHAIYHDNLGGLGSPEKADELFRKLALAGDLDAASAIAQRELAALNLGSLPAATRFARLQALAETGNSAAKREAALMRFRGEGTTKDTSEQSLAVLVPLEEAARAGDFSAALWRAKIQYLGLYHEAGVRDADTIMQDRFEAADFLHNVARNGSPLMRYRVGLLYLNDKSREPECFLAAENASLPRARELLASARDEGLAAAEAPLAYLATLPGT